MPRANTITVALDRRLARTLVGALVPSWAEAEPHYMAVVERLSKAAARRRRAQTFGFVMTKNESAVILMGCGLLRTLFGLSPPPLMYFATLIDEQLQSRRGRKQLPAAKLSDRAYRSACKRYTRLLKEDQVSQSPATMIHGG